ncbi:MAG: winged helix-turn-helix transcriptional regulator [Acidobacteria bacterium]|nr:winged helix-turn-helix transcriptional regulator [Acidobacteriota bacterium]
MRPRPARGSMRRIYELQCQICKAMAHSLRLEIVDLLGEDEISAASLLSRLGTSKANLSKHMTQLVLAGIVEQRRDGRQVFYRLTHREIHEACTIMRNILMRRIRKEEQLAAALAAPVRR